MKNTEWRSERQSINNVRYAQTKYQWQVEKLTDNAVKTGSAWLLCIYLWWKLSVEKWHKMKIYIFAKITSAWQGSSVYIDSWNQHPSYTFKYIQNCSAKKQKKHLVKKILHFISSDIKNRYLVVITNLQLPRPSLLNARHFLWSPAFDKYTILSTQMQIYTGTSSEHNNFSPKCSQKTLHSSPVRASNGVSFVSF